jgi:hypothetical protein
MVICDEAAEEPGSSPPAAGTAPVSLIGTELAKRLSEAHKAANHDRTNPGYGGQCDPDQYDKLSKAQQDMCKDRANGAQRLGKCFPEMTPFARATRINYLKACLKAREDVANQCFDGGDNGHRQQIEQVRDMLEQCGGTP